MLPKNRRGQKEWWDDPRNNLKGKHGNWTGSSEQKSILSNAYRAYLEKEAAGSSSSAKVKPSQFSGLRRE